MKSRLVSRLPFPVVGAGASAGGLEACKALLKALPADSGMAFVVVQHLDPHHRSLLRDLLAKVTKMPVAQAEDGSALRPNRVYVIPPNRDVILRRGKLRLSPRQQAGGKHMPIDRFLRSLAEDQTNGAIGIVLSGTGSDGTLGLAAVRAAGGIAFAQDPKSAQSPGMPESAIASGCVNFVLPPEGIARELTRLAHAPDTAFFRGPEMFTALRRTVFPKLLAGKPPGETLRVWVPSCATGEEAYSIAIALTEFLDLRAAETRCHVFATDVSTASLDKARRGTYSEAAVAGVSTERLGRFFKKTGANYQVDKWVRERCLFARHDPAKDPPFSRLDLIDCRDMRLSAEEGILSAFHYALLPGGFLLLGESETLDPSSLFTLADRKYKIYSRKAVPAPPIGKRTRAPAPVKKKGGLAALRRELASTREELQSIIERQQATNEELETAQEELQSSNEELTTLNDELQNRNAELGQLADDLSSLLVGVNIPIVIVGSDRRIRRFTPAAERLLDLTPADVGRPIGDIGPNLGVPELDRLISEVIGKLSLVERDVRGRDGRWYSLRVRPHRGADNKAEGVLMALMDIDVMKRGFDEAVAEKDLSATLLDLSGALIVIRDPQGAIIGFNSACQETSGYSFAEVKNRRLWDFLLAPEEVEPAKAVFAALCGGLETAKTHESSWIRKDGSRRLIAWSSLARRAANGSVTRIVSTGVNITQRKLTEDALRQSREELRGLTANLFATQEEERKRLARELHDDVNQRVAMLANEVNLLERDLPASADLVRGQLRSLRERVEELSDDLRRAAHQLHPSALEHFGLVAALESYCPDFSKLHPIQLKFTHRGVPEAVPFEVSLCLYRVAQECLHNVAKHSRAKEATLVLRGYKGGLLLSLIDKGEGFDPAAAGQKGLGMVGIRERVRLVGGSVSIDSSPGRGTQIDVRVPLNRTAS